MKLQRFKVEAYQVRQLSRSGAWLVQTGNNVDLGLLFLRAQEFYESADAQFCGKAFTLVDYIRWYCMNLGEDQSFDYFSRFAGYNIPSTSLDAFLSLPVPDATRYDLLFAKVVSEIKGRQQGPFCLIGTVRGDDATTDHELSHAMWLLMPEYRRAAQQRIKEMPGQAFTRARKELLDMGYSQAVIADEVAAYMATGVAETFPHLEPLRYPFIVTFQKFKRRFLGA